MKFNQRINAKQVQNIRGVIHGAPHLCKTFSPYMLAKIELHTDSAV